VIKKIESVCRKVPDPATLCDPKENLELVYSCDNSESGDELTCTYTTKIGTAKTIDISESAKAEFGFHEEVGYKLEAGLPGLKMNYELKIGASQLVGYNWGRSDKETFSSETTFSAAVKVRPYSHSKLEQLVGECSFISTRAKYFKNTQVNTKTLIEDVTFSDQ